MPFVVAPIPGIDPYSDNANTKVAVSLSFLGQVADSGTVSNKVQHTASRDHQRLIRL